MRHGSWRRFRPGGLGGNMSVGNAEAEGPKCFQRRWTMHIHGQISFLRPSSLHVNLSNGPFHIHNYPLCHLAFVITGNTLAVRVIFSSGTWNNSSKVPQAIQSTRPCSSLWGEADLGAFGTLPLKCLCNLSYHTNAKSPSAVSVLCAADPLSSESFRNLWRLFYCQVMKSQKRRN